MRKLIIAALVAAVIPASASAKSCQLVAQSVFSSVFSAQDQMNHPEMLAPLVRNCVIGANLKAQGMSEDAVIDNANSLISGFTAPGISDGGALAVTAGVLAIVEGYVGGEK